MEFDRITADPHQLGGVPCIRRLRIPVATVVGMVAEGMTTAEILAAYPDLVEEDISPFVAASLTAAGLDAVHVADRGLHEADDAALFDLAVAEGSTIVAGADLGLWNACSAGGVLQS